MELGLEHYRQAVVKRSELFDASGGRAKTGPLSFFEEGAECQEGHKNVPIAVAEVPVMLIDQELAEQEQDARKLDTCMD